MILMWRGQGIAAAMPDVQVTIFDHGKQIAVASPEVTVRELVARCEERLQTADGILRLAVTPALIQDIQDKELAVEIRYREPKDFLIPFNHQTLHPLRLLIPLTGEFAGGITTVFHGTTQYGAGPYRNKRDTEDLVKLVTQLER